MSPTLAFKLALALSFTFSSIIIIAVSIATDSGFVDVSCYSYGHLGIN
ncbi:hypothetical protein [Carboxydothermus hydrogenoformans]|nr:hypothetical protein [Carboxydothermus hydrogenoformans]